MIQQQESGKRIVSMSRYVQIQSIRASLWLYCLFCYLLALVSLCLIIAFGFGVLRFAPWPILHWSMVSESIWLFLFLPALIYLCFTAGESCSARWEQIEPVVPINGVRINRLSATESLVRASQEPLQEQKSVLLRSAIQANDTACEQLLKPMGQLYQTSIDINQEYHYGALCSVGSDTAQAAYTIPQT